MTQKDIHNILVKADMKYKAEVIKQFGYDVEKIKGFERILAGICNSVTETVGKALVYMNTEIE